MRKRLSRRCARGYTHKRDLFSSSLTPSPARCLGLRQPTGAKVAAAETFKGSLSNTSLFDHTYHAQKVPEIFMNAITQCGRGLARWKNAPAKKTQTLLNQPYRADGTK